VSVLPEVRDAADAAGLVRELFRNPPPAALDLAVPADASPYEAVYRYLKVALNDLPPAQASLLSDGAALLLDDPALAGYLISLLEDTSSAAVAQAAADAAASGALRGRTIAPVATVDLHALLLGLCARLNAPVAAAALSRDAADDRYRDLALLLLATAGPAQLAATLTAVAQSTVPDDERAREGIGRVLREVLQREGEAALLALLEAQPHAAAPALLAALDEMLLPARLALLTDDQQQRAREALRRDLRERPDDAYLRLRLDPVAREPFLQRATALLMGSA